MVSEMFAHKTLANGFNVCLDIRTGLEWLVFEKTLGMSASDIEKEIYNSSSTYYGFRYAAKNEVLNAWGTGDVSIAQFLGETADSTTVQAALLNLNYGDDPSGQDILISLRQTGADYPTYKTTTHSTVDPNCAHFLVKNSQLKSQMFGKGAEAPDTNEPTEQIRAIDNGKGLRFVDRTYKITEETSLSRWSVYCQEQDTVKFILFREDANGVFTQVGITDWHLITPGFNSFRIETPLKAQAGDCFGLEFHPKDGNNNIVTVANTKSGYSSTQPETGRLSSEGVVVDTFKRSFCMEVVSSQTEMVIETMGLKGYMATPFYVTPSQMVCSFQLRNIHGEDIVSGRLTRVGDESSAAWRMTLYDLSNLSSMKEYDFQVAYGNLIDGNIPRVGCSNTITAEGEYYLFRVTQANEYAALLPRKREEGGRLLNYLVASNGISETRTNENHSRSTSLSFKFENNELEASNSQYTLSLDLDIRMNSMAISEFSAFLLQFNNDPDQKTNATQCLNRWVVKQMTYDLLQLFPSKYAGIKYVGHGTANDMFLLFNGEDMSKYLEYVNKGRTPKSEIYTRKLDFLDWSTNCVKASYSNMQHQAPHVKYIVSSDTYRTSWIFGSNFNKVNILNYFNPGKTLRQALEDYVDAYDAYLNPDGATVVKQMDQDGDGLLSEGEGISDTIYGWLRKSDINIADTDGDNKLSAAEIDASADTYYNFVHYDKDNSYTLFPVSKRTEVEENYPFQTLGLFDAEHWAAISNALKNWKANKVVLNKLKQNMRYDSDVCLRIDLLEYLKETGQHEAAELFLTRFKMKFITNENRVDADKQKYKVTAQGVYLNFFDTDLSAP